MADNVQLQGIEFEIVGESEKAAGGIKTLTSSLKKLQAVAGKGLGLEKIKNEIKDLNETIGNIQDGGLIGLANSLGNIANASRKLGNVGEKLKNISELDFSNLQTAAQAIGAIADTAGWRRSGSGGSGNGGNSIPTDLPTTTPESEQVDGSSQAVENVENAQKRAASSGKALRQVIVNLAKEFGKGAVKAGKFAVNLAAMPFKKLAESIKNTIAPIKQFISSIARIAMYRVIRGLISGITQSLKEGINNLYAFSKAAGTSFHTAMDSMAADAQWLKNSLAAAVAPIIETLAPAIDALAAKIAHVLDLLAQLFAMLSGRSTYTKAIKSAKEYGEATGGAAKELRMLISGFDELNVFSEASSGGGGGADVGDMFEEEELPINDFLQKLKDAIGKGDWEGLGRLLGEKVNEIFDSIDWKGIGSKLGKAIDAVIRTAYSSLKTVDFKAIGADIATMINSAIAEINFDTAGRLFIRKFTALLDFIIGFIKGLSWEDVAKAIGDFFTGAFREASEWLHENDFAEIATTLSDGIKGILDKMLEAVREMDWKALGKAIGDALGNIDWTGIISRIGEIIWTAFKETLSGLLSTHGGRVFLLLLTMLKGIPLAFRLASPVFAAAALNWVNSGVSPLKALPALLGKIGSSTAVALTGGILAALVGIPTAFISISDAIKNGLNWLNGIVIPAATSLGGAGIGAIIGALGGPIGAGIGALIGLALGLLTDGGIAIRDHWTEISEWITQTWDNLSTHTMNVWNTVKEWLGTTWTELSEHALMAWDTISTTVTTAWDNCVLWVTTKATELKEKLSNVWTTISQFTTQIWTSITQFTTQTWTNIQTTMTMLFNTAKENVITALNTLHSTMTNIWENAKTATINAWTAMATGASQKFSEIKNIVVTMITTAANHIRNTNWYNLGVNLMQGFLNGLQSLMSTIWNSITGFVKRCTDAVRNVLGIHSPSTVWEEIGIMLDLGLQKGLEGGANKLMTTAEKITESLTETMNLTLPSPSDMVMDMSYGARTRAVNRDYTSYAVAREAGAECNRTMIVSNEQIAKGISAGVTEANEDMIAALISATQEIVQSIRDKDTAVYLDHKKISESVKRTAKDSGAVIGTGGIVYA